MENKVSFDYSKAAGFISAHEVEYMKEIVEHAKAKLVSKSGEGSDFLGWIDLPVEYDREEFSKIRKAAEKIRSDSEVLVVIGIGGSYLGARAAIEFLRHGFYNNISREQRKTPEIYFAGNNISSTYLKGLIDVIGSRDFSVNVISKWEPPQNLQHFLMFIRTRRTNMEGKRRQGRIPCYHRQKPREFQRASAAEWRGLWKSLAAPDDAGGRSASTAVGPVSHCRREVKWDLRSSWRESLKW